MTDEPLKFGRPFEHTKILTAEWEWSGAAEVLRSQRFDNNYSSSGCVASGLADILCGLRAYNLEHSEDGTVVVWNTRACKQGALHMHAAA